MSDQIASTPLEGPTRYDFGAGTPETWPQGYYVPEADYDALAAQLAESEQHRAKNRETAVALQDEVTDLRMKLSFRDAHIESLQNKWASRPLSSEDQAAYIAKLEAALKDIAVWQLTAETPEAMHARIVTETADAIASQMETKGDGDAS